MEAKTSKPKKDPFLKRIHEVDLIRGFLIILVVVDHIFINLGDYSKLWGIEPLAGFFYYFYYQGPIRQVIQPLALMAFCFISGVSCLFSRNNLKRALLTLGVWLLMAIGTNIAVALKWMTGSINLNIIGVLGFSMLFYALLEKRSWRILLAVAIFSLLMCSYIIPSLSYTLTYFFGSHQASRITSMYYESGTPNVFFPFFWEPLNQIDYVPLFPYVGFFFLGSLFSYFFYKDKKQSLFSRRGEWGRPICFVGRHTLIIYLSHIFIVLGIFSLLNLIINR